MKENKITFKSVSATETINFGERLGKLLAPGHVIALLGELGAGKTTMVKGIVHGLGVTDRRAVKSPTFALVHRYEGRLPVYHFDAYRLESTQEMLDIGSDEMIYGDGVSIIEWADKVPECLPEEYLKITLIAVSENERPLLIVKENKITFKSVSATETIRFGERLGKLLAPGHVIALLGELGAGKTTMVKGIVQGLGVTDRRTVKSPTFALVHRYEGRMPVYHFDAYRLGNAQEMLDIGSDEMIYGDGVSIIEWADKVPECLPEEYLRITLTAVSENERTIEIRGYGERYKKIIDSSLVMGND